VNRAKVLGGAILAVALVAGLYWANRYWIVPATMRQVKASGDHPLAPGFSLTDISGQKLNLADYKGKVVMLDFWATWCGPCRIEIPGFIQLQNRYRDQGFAIVGISMDDGPEPVRDFVKEFKMNYPVAMGSDKLGETFGGLLGLPTTFLIGRDGRIYAKHVGATDGSVFEEEVKKLLAAKPQAEVTEFKQLGGGGKADKIELGDPEEINSEVPGVKLTKLTVAQKEGFKKQLAGQACDCGCKFNVLECRLKDRKCSISLKLARENLAKFTKATPEAPKSATEPAV
jgi:cytochrome c biogenesis protein CcmG/thiol:disulfide interchange protein DsbE